MLRNCRLKEDNSLYVYRNVATHLEKITHLSKCVKFWAKFFKVRCNRANMNTVIKHSRWISAQVTLNTHLCYIFWKIEIEKHYCLKSQTYKFRMIQTDPPWSGLVFDCGTECTQLHWLMLLRNRRWTGNACYGRRLYGIR